MGKSMITTTRTGRTSGDVIVLSLNDVAFSISPEKAVELARDLLTQVTAINLNNSVKK